MNWADMTLREFQAALASSSPTPGGGTASAVALGQAASLSIMVCDLTLGNEKWQDGWAIAEQIQTMAIPMMGRSNKLATEDSQAFDRVIESFGLPKTTDEEKSNRRGAIRDATLEAAVVPFETASLALKLLTSLPDLAAMGNGNAVTDVGVAGLLASAAAKGAVFNVEINLDSLPEEMGESIRKELPEVKERTRIASRAVMDAVRERMGQ
uniref:Methenyl tetrahydrofolate cyclohydrolase n=1 Tax=uncultured archaeon MedDCM-OCT-S04-C14 TaxID=743084 RepID=D6PB16_9ARCH|nr:methenyl tetrahydrofolate cyclohydrolase [uncultured archaeon MedDCM-OCT-S04-C14]